MPDIFRSAALPDTVYYTIPSGVLTDAYDNIESEVDKFSFEQRSEHQKYVDLFMRKGSQAVPLTPSVPDEKVIKLRARLMLEEVFELLDAMCIAVTTCDGSAEYYINAKKLSFYLDSDYFDHNDNGIDMVGVADGLADIAVVVTGTASAFGISMKPIQFLVDMNNLAKFGPGCTIREDGKIIKPPDHKPPDIYSVLVYQGWVPPKEPEAESQT